MRGVSPDEEKVGYSLRWEGFAEKESFQPGVKERMVMDDESGDW